VAEWQAACRGIDGRLYPWGDDPAPARCNCWHAEDLGVPSSVGIYVDGATPEGVCDLAGNIAEWTSSIDSGDPVVSGGSWFQSIHRSRATQLRSVGPGVSSTEVGFRVVAP
jgi:formylglycine-generating enzyme required for sulfatase activity